MCSSAWNSCVVILNESVRALDRKSALYVSVKVLDRRSGVNGLQECDITMCGDGIRRNLSVELHLVQRQTYDCYTAMLRQRTCAWPVKRETGSPHWQSFEMTRKLFIMCSSAWNSWVVVVVNGFVDAGLCVGFGGIAKVEVSKGVRALDLKSAFAVGQLDAKFDLNGVG